MDEPSEFWEEIVEFQNYVLQSAAERIERLNSLHTFPNAVEDHLKDSASINTKLENELLHVSSEEKFPSKNLLSLFGQELLPANTFTQTFLQSILSSVDSRDPVVANAWMETLLDVIDLLPKEIIKRDILTLAVNKGQLSQPVSSRLLCCRLLGKICTKFDPYVIKKEILPVVLSLCQDVDYEVRGCMCRQLDVVAKGIGLDATKSAILPELVELANDEESCVRLAGIETVVQMLPMLDDETCIQAIIPLVKKLCENSIRSEDSTLPVVARQLGHLCHGLAMHFTSEQKQWFLKFYRELAKLGLPHYRRELSESEFCSAPMPDIVPQVDNQERYRECRYACAYNFPAMAVFAGPDNFKKELYETFSELCADPFLDVRKTIASGFCEITKLLGLQSPLILPELVCLLKDDSLEVLKGVIPRLPESLEAVCLSINPSNGSKDYYSQAIVEALRACEEATSVTSNWRLHADFLSRLSCLPRCLCSDVIYTTFVPLLFMKLHTARPIPCRIAAAYTLLVFLRNTPKLEHRNGIINELIRELCYGRSCHKRMLFIRICELIIELFSKAFFKQYFFKPLLELSEDLVPNIRLRLCKILPQLKALLKLPMDSLLLQQLESCVKTLMTNEKDKDVAAAVSKGIEELDKIEVATEPSSRRTSCVEPVIDLDDMRKEEEENHLLDLELKAKQESENNFAKCQSSTWGVNRQGRIPVRKSGTLPKQSKSKDLKHASPLKMRSPPSPSSAALRSIKQERRISSPVLILESPRSKSQASSPVRKGGSSTVPNSPSSSFSRSSIPICRSQSPMSGHSSRQTTPTTSKPHMERCPSPMPLSRISVDQQTRHFSTLPTSLSEKCISSSLLHQCSLPNIALLTLNQSEDGSPFQSGVDSSCVTSTEEKSECFVRHTDKTVSLVAKGNRIDSDLRHSISSSKEQSLSSSVVRLRTKHSATPFPSPEVTRRSLSSSPSSTFISCSRIPTSNSTLRFKMSSGVSSKVSFLDSSLLRNQGLQHIDEPRNDTVEEIPVDFPNLATESINNHRETQEQINDTVLRECSVRHSE